MPSSPKSYTSIFVRNLFSSWTGLAVNTAIAFFLSPFVVHSLGDFRYGIWSLVLSIVGYMGLADVGLRRSVTRFINYHLGRNEPLQALQVVSTSLFIILGVCVLIMVLGVIGVVLFPVVFSDIDSAYLVEIRIVIIIGSLQLCIGLLGSVFRRSIEAFDRFDVVNIVIVFQMVLRTVFVVLALHYSSSLIGLAIASFCSGLIASIIFAVAAFQYWPDYFVSAKLVKKKMVLKLLDFGWPTFFDNISEKIINYTDLLVIALLLGAEFVTIYSIGQMVALRFGELCNKIVIVLTPLMFRKTGIADDQAAKYILIQALDLIAFFCIPFIAGFLLYGACFISLWMGSDYVASAEILSILVVAVFFAAVASPSKVILLGRERQKMVATISMIQAGGNFVLSLVFVLYCGMGIQGVAVGTLIPAIIINGFILPLLLCKTIGLSVGELLLKTLVRWMVPAMVYFFICYNFKKYLVVSCWMDFVLSVLLLGIIYLPIGYFLVLNKNIRKNIAQFLYPHLFSL